MADIVGRLERLKLENLACRASCEETWTMRDLGQLEVELGGGRETRMRERATEHRVGEPNGAALLEKAIFHLLVQNLHFHISHITMYRLTSIERIESTHTNTLMGQKSTFQCT